MLAVWKALLPELNPPKTAQFELWAALHDKSIVRRGIIATAVRFRKCNGQMSPEWAVKLASSIMNRLAKEATHEKENQ